MFGCFKAEMATSMLSLPLAPSGPVKHKRKVSSFFHKYGDQYFLSQVWTIGGNSGRELPMPRVEREVEKNSVRQTIVLSKGNAGKN